MHKQVFQMSPGFYLFHTPHVHHLRSHLRPCCRPLLRLLGGLERQMFSVSVGSGCRGFGSYSTLGQCCLGFNIAFKWWHIVREWDLLLHYGGCCFPEQAMFYVWSGPTPAGAGTWKCEGRKAWVCGFLPWGACACGGACARGCSPLNGCAVWKCHQREGSVLSPGLRRRKRRMPVFSRGCTSGGSAEKACPPPTVSEDQ